MMVVPIVLGAMEVQFELCVSCVCVLADAEPCFSGVPSESGVMVLAEYAGQPQGLGSAAAAAS